MEATSSSSITSDDIVKIDTPKVNESDPSTSNFQDKDVPIIDEQAQPENVESVIGRNMLKFSSFLREVTGLSLDSTKTEEEANSTTNLSSPSTTSTNQESINETTEENKLNSPIIVLGQEFYSKIKAIKYIQNNLLWLSYRCGFEPILKSEDGPQPIQFFPSIIFNKTILTNPNNLKVLFDKDNFTSDSGWGCMIRTSQNLLANTLIKINGIDKETAILNLFQDNSNSLYSIHNFIRVSSQSSLQLKPGQWFGPNAASYSIKKLTDESNNNDDDRLRLLEENKINVPYIHISENCDLYDDEIKEIFTNHKKSILLLFPVRLGIDHTNEYYFKSLLTLLASPYSVGIAGGKPSSSFYFFGYESTDQNENELIYFDPHLPQIIESPINLQSYHCQNYNKLNIKYIDPSMMIGILISDMNEYNLFKKQCVETNNKIIHFHPITLIESHSSINQSWEEVNEEDDFVNLNVSKNEEEFIDLGNK
ncbi:ATG4 [Candida pseudojiufengensis]|uniref:ATG4 n=1 Tax=Candida pseudojiufengensis TaxID=497109 RepID=UPI002224F8AA|nr:ATG4 [Candida pseudojiufengensis]KAI5963681.1 ATG4 [Candida pseudojiufengensis]